MTPAPVDRTAASRSAAWRGALAAAALLLACTAPAGAAEADPHCGPVDARGIQQCRTGLAEGDVQQMTITQEKSQWCWAASIAMVLAHHGVRLPQAQIVERQFAGTPDLGLAGPAIDQLLARPWGEPTGRDLQLQVQSGHAAHRRFLFNGDTVIRELAAGRPLIVGALGHAMVLVQVAYERFPAQDAFRIVGGVVIDPAPGRGIRPLAPAELRPSYVAAVRVHGAERAQQFALAATP